MKPAAFLFDLDGTLIDTEMNWVRSMVDFVVEKGGKTTVEELLPQVVGHNWFDIDAFLHREFPMIGDTTPEEDAYDLRERYLRYAGDFSGMRIEPSIEFYKRAAKIAPCAIVSGSPPVDVLEAAKFCGIADLTAFVLGAGDYPKGKPDPSGFLMAAKRLGVDPADCVVVEDSTVGVASGVAAGMKVLAIERNRVPQEFTGATWKVRDLSEFDIEKEFGS